MSVEVRAPEAADAAAMQAIYAQCIEAADWLPEAAKVAPVLAEVSRSEQQFVAFEADRVLGFVSVHVAESFIHHLFVREDARRRGVGVLLLEALEGWLPRPWQLKCVRRNVVALRFYEGRGWREAGVGESEHGAYAVLTFNDEETHP